MVRPLTMSFAAWAATPVRSVMKPTLIDGTCAGAGPVSNASTTATSTTIRSVCMAGSSSRRGRSGLLELRLHVGPALPGQLLERHLGLAAVGKADDDGLREHADRAHLARHAAAAPAVGLAGGVHARQAGAQLLVGRELVEQAALEPAAVAEQAAVGERHVLRLGHLHGDRLELAQVGRAAELAAAGADAVHDARRVAGADLAHLDARAELAREIAHQLAEVDPVLGVEVHGDPAIGAVYLHVDHLDGQGASVGQLLGGSHRALLALPAVAVLTLLDGGGRADHAAIEAIAPEVRQRAPRAAHLAQRRAGRRLHHHDVADGRAHVVHELVVVGRGRIPQPDADQPLVARFLDHSSY